VHALCPSSRCLARSSTFGGEGRRDACAPKSVVKLETSSCEEQWLMAKSMVKMETFSCEGSSSSWLGARGHDQFVCVLTGKVVAWVMCLWAIKAGL
jgi:hypothetical protein